MTWKQTAQEYQAKYEEARAEVERLETEGTPGVLHEIDEAFRQLTVKQRDSAWVEIEQLRARLDSAESMLAKYVEQDECPYEDSCEDVETDEPCLCCAARAILPKITINKKSEEIEQPPATGGCDPLAGTWDEEVIGPGERE